jgi:hypothetical protein
VGAASASELIRDHAIVEWEEPDALTAPFGRGTISLHSRARFEHSSDFHFGLQQEVVAELVGDRPMSLIDIDRATSDLVSLVALATESAVRVRSVSAWPTAEATSSPAEPAQLRAPSRQWYGESPEEVEPRFTLHSLGDFAPAFIAAFARFRRENPEAAELLFEYQVFNGAMTPPDRFLYLARLLEALHRSGVTRKTTFMQRLTELLDGPGAAAQAVYGAPVQKLAKTIKDTRNFYVHYSPKDRARARHGISLDNLADRMWCVVRSALWCELGLAPERIQAILETDWRYERACEEPL